jgi:bifunctional ADP-heptose synthase (sugar kinase/adenylyltransferase)
MLDLDFKSLLLKHENDFKITVEYCGTQFIDRMPTNTTIKTLVVRASKYGTMVIEINTKAIHWVPAYWSWWIPDDQSHVVDVTGAGNAFCGGYAYSWIETNGNAIESAYYGAISSSYTVEQIGVPVLSGSESWNQGPSPQERLDILKNNKSCKF